jgi:3-oxoacyl-[acyl-carrier protein] reductase
MDLGIAGRRAIVCGASKGLGRGCAEALAREGVDVWLVARSADALAQTAREIARAAGGRVEAVAATSRRREAGARSSPPARIPTSS